MHRIGRESGMDTVLNRILGLVGIIFIVIGLTSCGSNGSGGGAGTKTFDELAAMVKKMDVSGAQGFVLTGSGGTAAKTSSRMAKTALAKAADDAITLEENSIYKVTDDGRLERVPVTDDMGNEVPRGTVRPLDVRDLDTLYAVFWFWIDKYKVGVPTGGGDDIIPYLVHKPTGLAYRASGVITIDIITNKNFHYERDVAGNLYFENRDYNEDSSIGRVFMVDGNGLGSSALTARKLKIPDDVYVWAIDANGTFIVYSGSTADGNWVTRFLDISTGVLTNMAPFGLPPTNEYTNASWTRFSNGKVYALGNYRFDASKGYIIDVVRVERGTDGTPVVTTIGPLSVSNVSGDKVYDGTSWVLWPNGIPCSVIGGKEIFVHRNATFEVFPEQAKVVVHDLSYNELSYIKDVHVSGNFIFYVGTSKTTLSDVVLRYDPVSITATTFDLGANFDMDLNHVKVLNSDTIWFEALRLSDQAKVIGKMASDGTVTIADVVAADEPQIIVMEAIHPTDFLVINGDMQEWSLDKRIQQDIAGDAAQGDDLRYYSEQKSKTNYFGLVEFEGNEVSLDGITRITIDNAYQIRIGSSSSEFRNLLADTSSALRNIGGIAARGVAVEFSVPLTALSEATFKDINVARVKEGLFGDANTITPVKNGTDWNLTIGMATPLGDATVEIALTGSYVLRFTRTGAVIDNGVTQNNLTDVGGSIAYPVTDGGAIVVTIPEAAIGSPASLSPTEQSGGQLLDVVIDVMGN